MNDTASYPEAGKEGLVKEIDDAVRMARTDEQFRSFYMLLEEKLMRERKSLLARLALFASSSASLSAFC